MQQYGLPMRRKVASMHAFVVLKYHFVSAMRCVVAPARYVVAST